MIPCDFCRKQTENFTEFDFTKYPLIIKDRKFLMCNICAWMMHANLHFLKRRQ